MTTQHAVTTGSIVVIKSGYHGGRRGTVVAPYRDKERANWTGAGCWAQPRAWLIEFDSGCACGRNGCGTPGCFMEVRETFLCSERSYSQRLQTKLKELNVDLTGPACDIWDEVYDILADIDPDLTCEKLLELTDELVPDLLA